MCYFFIFYDINDFSCYLITIFLLLLNYCFMYFCFKKIIDFVICDFIYFLFGNLNDPSENSHSGLVFCVFLVSSKSLARNWFSEDIFSPSKNQSITITQIFPFPCEKLYCCEHPVQNLHTPIHSILQYSHIYVKKCAAVVWI